MKQSYSILTSLLPDDVSCDEHDSMLQVSWQGNTIFIQENGGTWTVDGRTIQQEGDDEQLLYPLVTAYVLDCLDGNHRI